MSQSPVEMSEQEWIDQISELRRELKVPGFWTTLAENCASWAVEISKSNFWNQAKINLDSWRTEYKAITTVALLTEQELPDFQAKPEISILGKVIRCCKKDPEAVTSIIAQNGPPIPTLKDLVRTRIKCNFIDGVEFLATKLTCLAEKMELVCSREREGRIQGYFAQHITVCQKVDYSRAGTQEPGEIKCEIQIASDLSTRMWNASHPLYEIERIKNSPPEVWQWDPGDPLFISNQLGHMIHLADGLLMQLRDSVNKRKYSHE